MSRPKPYHKRATVTIITTQWHSYQRDVDVSMLLSYGEGETRVAFCAPMPSTPTYQDYDNLLSEVRQVLAATLDRLWPAQMPLWGDAVELLDGPDPSDA